MKGKKDTGYIAEDIIAKKYVKSRKWKVLGRNYSKPWGEIDIIARHKKEIIFIEVKALDAKNSLAFDPEDHFTREKQKKLVRICQSYLADNKYPDNTNYRIDLAAVVLDFSLRSAHVRYYKNAILK